MDSTLVTVAVITAVPSTLAAFVGFWNARKIEGVHKEVKTANAQSIGQLMDATETRRIEDKPRSQRTQQERDHVESTKDSL